MGMAKCTRRNMFNGCDSKKVFITVQDKLYILYITVY